MRVVCINIKPIKCWNGEIQYGGGLKEGEAYTVTDTIERECGECYIIKELRDNDFGDVKLCIRFKKLDEDWVENLLKNIKEEVEELELI